MTHCILLLLGLVILWVGIKTADEVYRLALTSAAVIPLSWGYFTSPFLFQCLSGIVIFCIYQMYISYS
ncbi:hypothetical protein I4641_22015 [Waterburya agarophytonicola K14]|uniref:Uncharacterized protein n=1 Tax=Waterburya agarophytonicola KI4 TaxID=2874699 RepID=A0A964FH46_9CYAN|nr:hypothetical protein [Waterburya agarophytonicola]MCC0179635.1 hypothetical protein [Waterburya agarophytonicola KI4]